MTWTSSSTMVGRRCHRSVSAKEVRCKVALPLSNLPGLDLALNPYVGCEHGCLYCFAPDVLKRDRSDWATRVDYRANLPVVLSRELRTKRGVIGIGTVTDPYQPLEGVLLLTRKCLMEISRHDNPISILTKSDLVLRDLELIIATRRPEVGITVTCMDEGLAKRIEPGAPSPRRRIAALGELSRSGVNSYAMIGPVLPFLEDQDLTAISEGGQSGRMRTCHGRPPQTPTRTGRGIAGGESVEDDQLPHRFRAHGTSGTLHQGRVRPIGAAL